MHVEHNEKKSHNIGPIIIPYSEFYLRGPNFCEIFEVVTSSGANFISEATLLLSFAVRSQEYLREPATVHVILTPGFPRKTTNRRYSSRYIKGSWLFRVSWRQTNTSITLDHTFP